jgi:phosphoglycerate dehydrogenase-like enzyme
VRIHIQNLPGMLGQPITVAEWQGAAARAGLADGQHAVTIGSSLDDYAAAVPEMEALVTGTSLTRQLFPVTAPQLKLLFCTSAGLDPVPFGSLPPHLLVLNNRGVHGPKAGEFGLMALLMLVNHLPAIVSDQRAGKWQRHLRAGGMLAGRRVTIVGLGGLGGAVAEQAAHFGMVVTGVRARPAPHPACARVVPTAELDAVLAETDILVLACPLTAATRNILDRRRMALLPPGAGVINIGRGALIEQEALCDALEGGHLGGAVLDVFVPEPVPPGHRLWSVPNLIMTPHVSSDDPATYNARSLDIFLENLAAFEAGREMPNLFDSVRGY